MAGTCRYLKGLGLTDLSDVDLTSPIMDDILVFNSVTSKWENLSIHDFIGGLEFDFWLSDTADGVIGGYLRMYDAPTGEGESTVNALIPGADTAIEEWITAADQPTFTILSAGVYTVHFHAEKDGPGKKDVRVYAELYKRATGGAETLLITLEDSAQLTTSSAQYEVHGTLAAEEMIASDDRLVLKTYGTPEGAGANPTVTIAMEGTTASRLEVQSDPSALDERYLRLDGANPMIGNLDMDSNDLVSVGNVGIGTASPQRDLHIESGVPTIRLSDSNAATDQAVATLIEFYRGNTTNRVGFLGMESAGNNNLRIATNYAAGQIQLGTGNSVTALTIDSSQRVGIGTIPKNWDPTTASVLQIFSGENALIGADGSIQLCQNAYWDNVDNRWEYVTADKASRYNQADGGHFFETAIAGVNPDDPITWLSVLTLDNSRNATFVGTIDCGAITSTGASRFGTVGIGIAPGGLGAMLDVFSTTDDIAFWGQISRTSGTNRAIRFICDGIGATANYAGYFVASGGIGNRGIWSSGTQYSFYGAVGEMLSIDTYTKDLNGDTYENLLVRDDGVFGYDSSTLAKKTNIREIDESTISWIYNLHPIMYDRKTGPCRDALGLIAEEVNEVNTKMVRYKRIEDETTYDEVGIPERHFHTSDIPEGVKYTSSYMITGLLKAVQIEKSKNEALEARVKALEGN